MAMPRKIPVDFKVVFAHGVYAVGEVQPVRDYDKSTKDRVVQAADPDTGLPLWQVEVIDGDPDARKSNRTIAVKVMARVQPVLPENTSELPFTPVEFDKLLVTAYIEENGNFSRVAWSFRASDVRAPGSTSGSKPEQLAGQKASA